MAFIFHIISKEEWSKAKKNGSYHPDSLEKEGFIHFSRADQVLTVANNFYKGHQDLLLLKVDKRSLASKLKEEPPFETPLNDTLFPHLYGPLMLNEVTKVFDFPCEEDGKFKLPKNLLSD